MAGTAMKVGLGIAALAAAAAGVIVLLPRIQGNPSLGSLALSIVPTTPAVGADVQVAVIASDNSGAPLAGVQPALYVNGSAETGVFALTGADGTSSATITFPAAGNYSVDAQAGGVVSNTVQVTVGGGTQSETVFVSPSSTALGSPPNSFIVPVTVNGTLMNIDGKSGGGLDVSVIVGSNTFSVPTLVDGETFQYWEVVLSSGSTTYATPMANIVLPSGLTPTNCIIVARYS